MLDLNEKLLCESCFAEQTTLSEICDSCGFDNELADGFSGFRVPGALPLRAVLNKRYHVGKILGRGGFGVIYLAYDAKRGRKVAVKEFFPEKISKRLPDSDKIVVSGEKFAAFKMGTERFIEEARILSRFSGNANIIKILDCFLANGTVYNVMEYSEGMDLRKYVEKSDGSIPYDEAIKILIPVLYALISTHNEGLLHGDVSPDNIYITNDGSVKLLDFGAARSVSRKSYPAVLKRGFAPPEQYGGECGTYSDIYSLGASFYYALTGKTPDGAEFVPPSQLGFYAPPEFEKILKKTTAQNPKDRYQTVAELKEALRKMETKKRVRYSQKSAIKKGFAIFVIAGIIVIAILIFIPNSTDDSDAENETGTATASETQTTATNTTTAASNTTTAQTENVWDESYLYKTPDAEIQCYYSGEWKNDAPNGWGILTYNESGQSENSSWEEGDQLAGNFSNGKAEGRCRFYAANGAFMEAVFEDGAANGDGYFIWPDNTRYSGSFKNGLPHGEGVYYDADGNIEAEGLFENGTYVGPAPTDSTASANEAALT